MEEIEGLAGEKTAEGIKKVRSGDIIIDPGFDGVFGIVKIWIEKNAKSKVEKTGTEQASLF